MQKTNPESIVEALVITDMVFDRKHTTAGTIIRLKYAEARHLEAAQRIMLGDAKELQAEAQKIKDKNKQPVAA
jgi:hypothetical protein